MSSIIKNNVKFLGEKDDVKSVIKSLKSKKSLVDFNKIVPVDKIGKDFVMDDYLNACINLYMIEQNILSDDEDFVQTMKFIGNCMEVPYTFKVIDMDSLKRFTKKYTYSKMIGDAYYFISKVKNKEFFNNYMMRTSFWGTGSGAKNPIVHGNSIEFETSDKPAIKVFTELSKKYPNIAISYSYEVNGQDNEILIQNGNFKVIKESNYKEEHACSLIKENCKI